MEIQSRSRFPRLSDPVGGSCQVCALHSTLQKHCLDYHWARRSTQNQDLLLLRAPGNQTRKELVSCTVKPRPREASATSVGTGTQAVWPLVQRRVFFFFWGGGLGGISGHVLIFRSPHPGPVVPVENPAFSLALPHELLFSCCFSNFPFVTASSIFARMCICPAGLYVCRAPRAAGIRGRQGDPI